MEQVNLSSRYVPPGRAARTADVLDEALDALLLLLAPMTPHVTAELWEHRHPRPIGRARPALAHLRPRAGPGRDRDHGRPGQRQGPRAELEVDPGIGEDEAAALAAGGSRGWPTSWPAASPSRRGPGPPAWSTSSSERTRALRSRAEPARTWRQLLVVDQVGRVEAEAVDQVAEATSHQARAPRRAGPTTAKASRTSSSISAPIFVPLAPPRESVSSGCRSPQPCSSSTGR